MSVSEDVVNLSAEQAARTRNNDQATSSPLYDLNAGREAMLAYFNNTWQLTELLFSALTSDEAFYLRPYHKTRHPLVFYYAHPACLYVNKLLVAGLIDEPVNQEFELLFETGVDEMTWDDLHEGEDDIWPALADVRAYRGQVYKLVSDLIQTHPVLDQPVNQDSPAWALVMAFEHERIHLETSSVLMRELPPAQVNTPPGWPALLSPLQPQNYQPRQGEDYPHNSMRELPASQVSLGKPRDWPSFGWDNEYGKERRQVAPFRASEFLISNGELFEFVKAGGYETRRYWSDEGWAWRQFRNVKWPTFWVQDGPAGSHRYRLRAVFEEVPMQWRWPAIVNYFEASAYCAWLAEYRNSDRPFRLLSEAEHIALRDSAQREAVHWRQADNNCLAADAVMQASEGRFNHNLNWGGESAVDALPANQQGFHDTFGNVWQWCNDTFHPLDGFDIHPYYTDFSTPCFDGAHQMILGGSFISTGDEASIWARFHFRPHFFQHAGFRVVQDMGSAAKKGDKYDTDAVLDQYLLFHYGSSGEQRDSAITAAAGHPEVKGLVARTVELLEKYCDLRGSVLDLGCAVGGASFELAREFKRVLGLDYSQSFIDAAGQLAEAGELAYSRWETGRYRTPMTARVDGAVDRTRVQFLQGDATNLDDSPELESAAPFDAILLSNLLCRLSNPQQCLRQFVSSNRYLRPGGILVIASPNTWMEDFTPGEKFLDGLDSEATLAAVGTELPGFKRLHAEDLPFLIREHRRKYEYIISQVSVWQKPADQVSCP